MNSDTVDEGAVIHTLDRFLRSSTGKTRLWAINGEPLVQRVAISSTDWRSRLSSMTLSASVREGVHRAISQMAENETLDRSALGDLARHTDEPVGLVACWFAAMCWGAGRQNRTRLRQWIRSLDDARLVPVLADSRRRVIEGDLPAAYRACPLPGFGESFFTKWLWVVGLPESSIETRPYVLDRRVRQSLHRLGWQPPGGPAAERWHEYCRAIERWATVLNDWWGVSHADGDRIEQLLFDRVDSHSLYRWLGESAGSGFNADDDGPV